MSATLSTFQSGGRRRGKSSTSCPGTGDAGAFSASPSRRGVRGSFAGSDPNVRVLVVFEDRYRAYRDAIAGAIRSLRPQAKVEVAEPDSLEAEMERLEPHLVICSRPNLPDEETAPAWVELPYETGRPATVWLEGRGSEAADPTLDRLLSVVDEVGRLVRSRPRRTDP